MARTITVYGYVVPADLGDRLLAAMPSAFTFREAQDAVVTLIGSEAYKHSRNSVESIVHRVADRQLKALKDDGRIFFERSPAWSRWVKTGK